KGTFNGNPVVAAAGIAALNLIASGDVQAHADKMAAKMRDGIGQIFTEHQVDAVVYGESSTFHMFFGNGARNGIKGRSALEIRGIDTNVVKALRSGLRARNVDLMSHTSGVTSLAHTEADIDETLSAFNATIEEMIQTGLLGRL
ncbi:MAG: glutamate-1-semialdehyde 2,1-aminomutase, partial [Proteobacteria bacterium]|nr:glutamate-1-semialdehyde 2,1-aminomutase [Pseudomonadota bacterium]